MYPVAAFIPGNSTITFSDKVQISAQLCHLYRELQPLLKTLNVKPPGFH